MASAAPRVKLQSVETARGIAAILVVLYHAARHVAGNAGYLPFGSFSKFGHAGVDFFFVLSGFIILFIHHADIGRPERAGHYLKRRVTRIYPVYWAALAATLALIIASPSKTLPGPLETVRDVFLLPFGDPTLGVAWSLQFEVAFYAFFLVLILNLMAGLALAAVWAIYITVLIGGPGSVPGDAPWWAYSVQFVFGLGAAGVLLRFRIPAPRAVLIAGLTAFLAFGLLENIGLLDGYAVPARFAYGFSAMITLIGLVEADRSGLVRVPKVLAELGSSSYSIYLFHLMAIGVVWQVMLRTGLDRQLSPEVTYVVLVMAGVIGGVAASRLVERPLMGLARRLIDGPRRDPAPTLAPLTREGT
ncbi:MAG: acyltransferase family protein [Rhodospirillaceae bacterium]